MRPPQHTPHQWSGRRGGSSWNNASDARPALDREYNTAGTANWLGFRTVLNHREATR